MVVALRMVPMEERWMIPLPEEQETLGKYLRKLRTQRGLTQRQVADATGIEQNRLSQWENDQYTPRGRTLRPLETFFGLAPGTIARKALEVQLAKDSAEPTRPLPGPSVAIPFEKPLLRAVKRLYILDANQLEAMSALSNAEFMAFVEAMRQRVEKDVGDEQGEIEDVI